MEIKKYQAGGYLTYQPLPILPRTDAAQTQPSQSAEQAPVKKDSYIDDDLLKGLLGKGITVDVMQYSDKLNTLSKEYENMSALSKTTNRGVQIRSMLKGDMGTLNGLIRSKEFFDDSMKNAKSNKALDEFAVNGASMFVKDADGKISNVSFGDYAKNKDKYHALTNAELAEQREFNKSLVGNTSIYSTLNYGKGMELIKDEVTKVLSNLGSNSSTVSNGSFQVDNSDIAELKSAAQQGIFKIKTGESIQTNSPQIEKAKRAMWLNLSENSKNVLRARAASLIDDPSKIESTALTMAASLLDPAESITTSKTYDITKGKDAKGGSGGSSEKSTDIGGNEAAFLGISNSEVINQIADYGVSIQAIGNLIPSASLTDKDGNLVRLRNDTKLRQMGKVDKAFNADGSTVDIDKTSIIGNAYFTEMMVTSDGNGGIKVDEEGNKRLAEFKDAVSKSDKSALKVSELRQQYGINSLNLKKMIVAEAASYDPEYWRSSRDSKYFKKIDPSTQSLIEKLIPEGDTRFLDHDIHKHLIFIPALDGMGARSADGNSAKIPESAVNFGGSYNTGSNGMNIASGTGVGNNTVDESKTSKYFENKK